MGGHDEFGKSFSLSSDGQTLAALSDDGHGYVQVYEYGTNWVPKGDIIHSEDVNDESGTSVSLSADGSIVAIGAHKNKGNENKSVHVRIYEYSTSTNKWAQLGNDIDGETSDDKLGFSVSLSADGNTVAIGAKKNDGNGITSGHVRIYGYSFANGWVQLGNDIDSKASSDESGYSVSISADGSIVAIGAKYNDDGNGSTSGYVRIYQYGSANAWIQLGDDIDGEAKDDQSGYSVSLSADGRIVAIGAKYNDGNGNKSGHVRIYQHRISTNEWDQLGCDIDGEASDDQSLYSVSLSADGSIVAIGTQYIDGNGNKSSQVRIYQYSSANELVLVLGDSHVSNANTFFQLNLT